MNWNSEEGQKLAQRLKKESVIWLTTVRPDGQPLPTPVWFLWEGDTILIYTLPGSVKLKNIAENPKAALNLNSDEWGGNVVVFTGRIKIVKEERPAIENADYIGKYREGIADIQMTPEKFSHEYSIPLRMQIEKIRNS